MDRTIKLLRSDRFLTALLLILIGLIAYAPLLLQLGYYRDDWYLIWSGSVRGAGSIIDLFSSDRPFMGVVYSLEYALLGDSPLAWHMFALLLRLLGAFALLWLLLQLWPGKKGGAAAIVLLFLVYPGFLQQPSANTFQNHLMTYLLAILSISLTVKALKTENRLVRVVSFAISLLLALGYFLIYEYFIGLEVFRIAILWLLSKDHASSLYNRLRWLFKIWLPYIFVTGLFLFWRVFIFKSSRPTTNIDLLASKYADNPILMMARMFIETIKDFFEAVFLAWAVPFYQLSYRAEYKEWIISIILALAGIGIFLAYLYLGRKRNPADQDEGQSESQWGKTLIWIGSVTVLGTLFPMVAAGRDVYFADQFDRYTLQSAIGVSILLVGLAVLFVKSGLQRWLFALFLGAAIVTHFHNAVYYREAWNLQKEIWWQLSWRAPQLEPGTTIIVNLPPGYRYAENYEVWAPANLIYYPHEEEPVIYSEILNDDTTRQIMRGEAEERGTQNIRFNVDYKKSLILTLPNRSACVHVLDRNLVELPEGEDPWMMQIAAYSHIETIKTGVGGHQPPVTIFGQEPDRNWCYYYQKTDYYRQMGDWEEAARMIDEAFSRDLYPRDLSEWLLVFEAYANAGRVEDANTALSHMNVYDKDVFYSICSQLEGYDQKNTSPYPGDFNFEVILSSVCK